MASSFSGGGSRNTRREPPTMGKQLVNFITCGCESSTPFFVIYKAVGDTWPNPTLVLLNTEWKDKRSWDFVMRKYRISNMNYLAVFFSEGSTVVLWSYEDECAAFIFNFNL
jgi:hypothetical protein